MNKLTKQQSIEACRTNNSQFFREKSGRSKAPVYSAEDMERLAVKNALDDGEIHAKRARIMLRKIRLKYNDQR